MMWKRFTPPCQSSVNFLSHSQRFAALHILASVVDTVGAALLYLDFLDNQRQIMTFNSFSKAIKGNVILCCGCKKSLTDSSLQFSTSVVSHMPESIQTKTRLSPKPAHISLSLFQCQFPASCEAWQLVQVIELKLGGEEWSASTCTSSSVFFFKLFPQFWFPLISVFYLSHLSPSLLSHHPSFIWFYPSYQQMPIPLSDGLSLSPIPTPTPFLPPTRSHSLSL